VRFHIRARVVWKRAQPGRRALPQGIGIEFLATEGRTQQQILRFAEGRESVNHVDRERRWRLNVDVTLAHQGHDLTGVTDDLSEGGCFVLAHAYALLPVGTVVDVRLRAPGSLFGWMTLPAQVTWLRHQPSRDGMGLEFRFASERQRNKIKKIVRVHRERLLRDVTVKVPRTSPPRTVD
jgi:c-di-GMP-binding flagellar brake protein YcgR